ncbi:hypothetical protein ACVRW4_04765 [Streptococcus phocae subsp. phocae]
MSRYKIAAITAIAAMSLLTGTTASATDFIQGEITLPQAHKTSDPCTSELKSTNNDLKVINIAPLGDRGTEGFNAEIISGFLKHLYFFKFNTYR